MQADPRRLTLLWLSLILILMPLTPLQAQNVSPLSGPETGPGSGQSTTVDGAGTDGADPSASAPATSGTPMPDQEAIQRTIDALIDTQVDELIAQMGTEDKVGQLFLINFAGNDTSIASDIAVLIHAYRIGGVVLSPRHNNFTDQKGVDTPAEVASLTNRLQALAYGLLLPDAISLVDEVNIPLLVENLSTLADEVVEADRPAMNIPLFTGVEQLGDDLSVTSLRRGFTALPNQMTLGAAWDPQQARDIGQIVGSELSAVGVNLLFGPSLDMLVQPRPESVGSLGVHVYGGDPYWVSEMGRSYITGIHEGSNAQLLTITRHFPGQGDVDRLPDQEVATIQGDIESLRTTAMVPFEAVTDGDASEPPVTDMMMASNMRFSGVQGAGPERIPPFGLSPYLTNLLDEEGFGPWHDSGLIVSNSLGVPAIRRYYETNNGEFPARQVAQDAFDAGNDLLYLGNFSENGDWEAERVNIESTISFFQERYERDDDFSDKVDAAVRRILRTKLRLYADMEALEAEALSILAEDESGQIESGAPDVASTDTTTTMASEADTASTDSANIGRAEPPIPLKRLLIPNERLEILDEESAHHAEANALVRQIARDSLTVLYPDIRAPSESAPQPPKAGDKIVIFTDSRLEQECSDCTAEVAIGPDDIENIILLLYGPDATAQIEPEQLTSLTFTELVEMLDASDAAAEDAEAVATALALLPTPTAETPAAAESENNEAEIQIDETPETPDLHSQIERNIDEATWLIFAMLDVDPTVYSSDAVKRFLRERGDQIEGKKVVVLALQAPYFLDATEISALSSYLGAYSKSASFLENAIRAIFQSYTPYGAPPVSVPGTRFADLADRLQPNPLQTIDLQVQANGVTLAENDSEAGADTPPEVPVGTTIRIQVGPVLDKNGQTVPDNTLVDFQLIYEGEELALKVEPASTRNGVAVRDVPLERSGALQISASANGATTGAPYSLIVTAPEVVANDEPTAEAGAIQPSGDLAVGASPNVTTSGTSELDLSDGAPTSSARPEDLVNLTTLIIALLTLLVTISLLLIVQIRVLPRTVLVHNLLWTALIGISAYIIFGVGLLPGAAWLFGYFDVISAGIVVLVSMIGTMLWLQLRSSS